MEVLTIITVISMLETNFSKKKKLSLGEEGTKRSDAGKVRS